MILSIADDLTGALEVGAKFAGCGIASCVTTDRDGTFCPEAPALVIDTETRHLPEHEAAAIVRAIALAVRHLDPALIYKKTDSTLRGNIAAELRALLEAIPGRPLIYAPAYPELGRTVRNGHLFVDGTPVHRTAFAYDPLEPIRSANIAEMFGNLAVAIRDGEAPEDVAAAASEILSGNPVAIAAGPASLAGALAERLGTRTSAPLPRLPRCLVVNGSLHPASAAQISFAASRHCLDDNWVYFDPLVAGSGVERAERTGESVRAILATRAFGGLIVFGGDTAFGIHRALGVHRFKPYGEVIRGVPVSRSGDLLWVTKAGGFGAPDLLCELRKLLT